MKFICGSKNIFILKAEFNFSNWMSSQLVLLFQDNI